MNVGREFFESLLHERKKKLHQVGTVKVVSRSEIDVCEIENSIRTELYE